MDLEKELHPLSHYVNDREEMINQVFKIIRGPKLRAMLTSGLRDIDTDELKSLCLVQLEGMSKKRIKYILAGREMDESSATDESEESDDQGEDDDEANGIGGSLSDVLKPALLNRNSASPKNATADDKRDDKAIEVTEKHGQEEEEEEDEDLEEIIDKKQKNPSKSKKVRNVRT